mmetsp:Transcript_7193/g.21945  ORF Transcript_7193/g.21945 Transcript_7193/m.21945 type:complete len:207 (-) Transcript_7193:31-651(-)
MAVSRLARDVCEGSCVVLRGEDAAERRPLGRFPEHRAPGAERVLQIRGVHHAASHRAPDRGHRRPHLLPRDHLDVLRLPADVLARGRHRRDAAGPRCHLRAGLSHLHMAPVHRRPRQTPLFHRPRLQHQKSRAVGTVHARDAVLRHVRHRPPPRLQHLWCPHPLQACAHLTRLHKPSVFAPFSRAHQLIHTRAIGDGQKLRINFSQ